MAAILTWRNEDMTRACLQSLTRSLDWPFPVLIIDNASGTSEGARIAADFGAPVESVTLESNGGVPNGYNAGLRWASGRRADYVALLNNDTLLADPAMVRSLLAATGPDVAAVGPRIVTRDGTTQSAGGLIRWRTGRSVHLSAPPDGADGKPYEVDWLDGACLMVSLAAARAIGGLPEDFFLYWEDVDWGVRAGRARLRCVVQPSTSIVHLGSATVTGPMQLRYWMRNKILFMRRNASRGDSALAIASLVIRTIPYHLARQGLAPAGWLRVLASGASAIAWNVTDAIRRRSWRVAPSGPSIDGPGTSPVASRA